MELEQQQSYENTTASRTASGIPLKDPDSIKLFVGQVPRGMMEDDLRPIFEEFGQLYELLVLRDKATGQHKGCAFVTYCTLESAEKAQRSLHGNKVLTGMQRAIQVKPANADDVAKLERKIFIGMISKQATEEDIQGMFNGFGEIEELSILKGSDGDSKGCAFIKFAAAKDCHKAIRSMHHSLTMQGCSSPLVVKWADTDRERVVRRAQKLTDVPAPPANQPYPGSQPTQRMMNFPNNNNNHMTGGSPLMNNNSAPAPANNSGNSTTALLTAITPLLHNLANQSNPETNKALVNALIAALQALANCNNGGGGGNNRALTDIANLLNATVAPSSGAGGQDSVPSPYSSQQQQQSYNSCPLTSNTNLSSTFSSLTSLIPQQPAAYPQQHLTPAGPFTTTPTKQSEGPDGANLFIYHIPSELRDNDLTEMFSAFGTILSCKVFIDKATNQSKCFGFVSYDNPTSAQSAITAMNGFKIGSKRLKVQLKKPKDGGKPF